MNIETYNLPKYHDGVTVHDPKDCTALKLL